MEGLRLDHMTYLQTLLARTSNLIDEYNSRAKLTPDATSHLRTLKDNQKKLRKLILTHG